MHFRNIWKGECMGKGKKGDVSFTNKKARIPLLQTKKVKGEDSQSDASFANKKASASFVDKTPKLVSNVMQKDKV